MTNILMRNKANNNQARVPMVTLPRSVFPCQKYRKQTMKAGYLYPIFVEEVLPSDTWEINMSMFTRLMTQLVAPMDNLIVKTYFFFDPTRLAWENFPKQHGERKNPNDTIDYITPSITFPSGIPFKSLYDYLGGVRCNIPNTKITSIIPRSYNRIWNAYFRAEMLQDSVYENDTDTDDSPDKFVLLKKAKMHDYFTDCLPTLQAGEPVTLPLGTTAPVIGNGMALGLTNGTTNVGLRSNTHSTPEGILRTNTTLYGKKVGTAVTNSTDANLDNAIGVTSDSRYSGLYADLSSSVSASIAAMRLAIDTQEILERDNRNGVRYTEQLQGRYGAINPDLRLNRPQYLGGTATPLFTTPVVQTSGSGTTGQNTPQGNIAGFGTATDRGNVIRASFGEFGHIIGLCCIQAVPQYQQGLHKKWSRYERFDYYYPEFNGLSDQAVKNGEIFYQGGNVKNNTTNEPIDDEVFGYIGRYDEYRYFNNEICGEMRSDYPQSLDVWHYAEKFENLPRLNGEFIQDKTNDIVKRSIAIQNVGEEEAEQFLCEFDFSGSVARVMPSKAQPRTGGRIL